MCIEQGGHASVFESLDVDETRYSTHEQEMIALESKFYISKLLILNRVNFIIGC